MNDKYFGVFQFRWHPQYTAVYNYSGNTLVTPAIEFDLRLNKRTDNSNCMDSYARPGKWTANTITVTGQSTEYILGSRRWVFGDVNLITFNAAKENDKALLYWNTGNEINLLRYGSGKKLCWRKTICKLPNHRQRKYITAIVCWYNPLPAINYYRLRIIDKDGSFGTALSQGRFQ